MITDCLPPGWRGPPAREMPRSSSSRWTMSAFVADLDTTAVLRTLCIANSAALHDNKDIANARIVPSMSEARGKRSLPLLGGSSRPISIVHFPYKNRDIFIHREDNN